MYWLEVTLCVDGEAAEEVADLLGRFGHQGVVVEQEGATSERWEDEPLPTPTQVKVRAYLPADDHVEETRLRLERALAEIVVRAPLPLPLYRTVAESDWSEAWKAHYHPLRIGRRLLVRPPWEQAQRVPGDLEIVLDPGMAFGTGTHPSTQLCLEALEELTLPGAQVLDLGCGSGILAIAAAKLGAAHVLALDTDPLAVKIAQQNIERNGVADKISVQEGSLTSLVTSARRFDLAAVNILAKVIIELCEDGLGQVIRPGGQGIFSGIITEQAADVEAALRTAGLQPQGRRQQDDWVLIEARRPHDQAT